MKPGARLGHYEVLGPLGSGGMGEVVRASDTKLGRHVAIKMLPQEVADNAERLARFRREAKLLAALNHANIAAIYGLEEVEERPFLALELVEGEDLAQRLKKGPIPLDEAIEIALQIAAALEEAHGKGIVHRDLKPANVKVTPAGQVKILDFGLAKAQAGDAAEAVSDSDFSQSPTLAPGAGTQAGVILGTAAYMAPEQARGKAVDKRADIWAFGVVLYETLAGKQLFEGETVSDTLAAVLKNDPDWSELPAQTPPTVRHLLRRCLNKNPNDRLHEIADARIALREVIDGVPELEAAEGAAGAPRPGSRTLRWRRAGVGIALLLALSIGVFLGVRWASSRSGPSTAPVVRFTLHPPPEVEAIWNPVLSNDGTYVVYEGWSGGGPRLYLHRLDEVTPRSLPGTSGGQSPFLSPDGRWIGFRQGTRLRKISSRGGDVLTICDVPGGFPGAAWRSDDTILFARAWLGGLGIVSAGGGEPEPLTEPDVAQGEKGHWWPRILPGGRAALFTIWRSKAGLNDASVALLDLDTRKYRSLFAGADARFLPPAHIIYYRAGAYHAVPFDLNGLRVTGDPVPILEDASDLNPQGDELLPLTVADNGLLVYTTEQARATAEIGWVMPGQEPQRLPFPARFYTDLNLSPDGRTLSASSLEAGTYVIRLLDLQRGTEERLTLSGSNWTVRWHPDGRRFAFRSMRKGDFDVYMKDLLAGGPEQPLLVSNADESPVAWSPDGKRLLFWMSEPDGSNPLKAMTIEDAGEPRVLASSHGNVQNAAVSSDGRWLAFASGLSGKLEIYVQPFDGAGPVTRISREGGRAPLWSPAGEELFFRRGNAIVALAYRVDAGRFIAQKERTVLEAPIATATTHQFQGGPLLSPDGQRFLVLLRAEEPEPPQLRVVLNWSREVDRKAPSRP